MNYVEKKHRKAMIDKLKWLEEYIKKRRDDGRPVSFDVALRDAMAYYINEVDRLREQEAVSGS